MCCTIEGSHQLGSRSCHRGAAGNPCLIFRSIILPAAIMPGIGFRLAHLQEMTISCTQGIRSIHEFRHILVTDVQHPCSMPATCSLEACPCPVMAILISEGHTHESAHHDG